MSDRILQLDGLRALAFLAVLISHLGLLPAGWMGVEVFFVLSGFLITSILRKRRAEPHPLRHFYANRVRRILPPYLLCLAFSAVFFSISWRHVWLFYALPLENVASLYHSSEIGPLGPLWSLAIEEQFYLLWPLLVFTLPRKALLWVLAAILVLSPVLRMAATPALPSFWAIFYLTPFRLDVIGAGSLVALLYESPAACKRLKKCAKPMFLIAMAALVVASRFGCNRESNSPLFNCLGYSVIIVMSAGILMWAAIEKGWLFSLLTVRPLRYIGRISYMAYLIHLPMISLLQHIGLVHGVLHGARLAVVSVPFTFFFASASWYLIERPILYWNHPNKKSASEIASAA